MAEKLRVDLSGRVDVEGLVRFGAALREAAPGLQRALRDAQLSVANRVVRDALGRISTPVSSRARASVKARATQREARIEAGGPRAPEFYGQEFGGRGNPRFPPRRGRVNRTNQFPMHRGREGYWLSPAFRDARLTAERELWEAIDQSVLDRAFPE